MAKWIEVDSGLVHSTRAAGVRGAGGAGRGGLRDGAPIGMSVKQGKHA